MILEYTPASCQGRHERGEKALFAASDVQVTMKAEKHPEVLPLQILKNK